MKLEWANFKLYFTYKGLSENSFQPRQIAESWSAQALMHFITVTL